MALQWARALLVHRRGRTLAVAGAVALTVAFVGALGAFLTYARGDLTRRSVSAAPIGWQIALTPQVPAERATAAIPPVLHPVSWDPPETVGYGDAARLEASTGGTVQTTGSAKVVGISGTYAGHFPAVIRPLVGQARGILLAQQTAANLHAGPGDRVLIGRTGRPDVAVTVDGIVDLPAADAFFQSTSGGPGGHPQAPPDNVVLMPLDRWTTLYDPAGGSGTLEVHETLAPELPADPSAAYARLLELRNGYEATLAGGVAVADNLAAAIGAARTDASYGSLLFAFLGLPGVAVAGALTWLVTATGRERRRREQALLRARGATVGALVRLAAAESVLIGLLGSGAGLLLAALAARSLWGLRPGQAWWAVLAAVGAGVAAVAGSVLVPAVRDARDAGRPGVSGTLSVRSRGPARTRAVLVVAAAAGAAVVTWVTTRQGYEVVVAPEGVPTVKVSYLSLLGPALAWVAGAAILPAFAGAAIVRGQGVIRRVARLLSVRIASLVARWLERLRGSITRAVLLLGLAVAFAVSAGIFDASFAAQSRVDAQLTNGADVAVRTLPGVDLGAFAGPVAHVRGVAAVEPMQHRFAYVGNDLQDLYGVRPDRLAAATPVSDAFFGSGDAAGDLRALAATPDGIFVSDETVKDFQLRPGDPIRIRLLDQQTHVYTPVPFQVLGVVREFPTAPTDSFLVANASYVGDRTRSRAAETLLIRTKGRSPAAVARDLRTVVPASSGAQIRDIEEQRRITGSGLVALDVAGLSALELGFGAVATFAAVGLLVALAFTERRRSLAILRALGARSRDVAALVVAETATLVALGTLGGGALGGTIGWVLVSELRGVFDPPPAHPLVPVGYLAVLGGMLAAGALTGVAVTLASASRLRPATLRDLTL